MQFKESDFQPRTRETHDAHCSGLQGSLRNHISTTYGINRESILNSLRYFHTVEGLVPDINMHDVLEGTLQLCVKQLLVHYVIEEKLFSLTELNRRIAIFKYGWADVKNKPTPFIRTTLTSTENNGLKQSSILSIGSCSPACFPVHKCECYSLIDRL